MLSGPILDSKDVHVIFQKKGRKMAKKEQTIWKFQQKCTKFEVFWKKAARICPSYMKDIKVICKVMCSFVK